MSDDTPRELPHDAKAEAAVLGAILIDNERLKAASDIVQPEHFCLQRHQILWRTFLELEANGEPIDSVTVPDKLSAKDLKTVGGREEISRLSTETPMAGNWKRWAGIVLEKYEQRIAAKARGWIELEADKQRKAGLSALEAMQEAAGKWVEYSRSERRLDVIDRAPTMASVYGLPELEKDRTRELVSLARLPEWKGDRAVSVSGHGWGDDLNGILGGGVCPGYMLAIGASRAKAGKTSFVMQVADGLALRTAELLNTKADDGPLTPVLVCSEMSVQALTWRSLARWTGHSSGVYRAGKQAHSPDSAARAWEAAKEALNGPLGVSREYMRVLPSHTRRATGPALLDECGRIVRAWRRKLEDEHQRDVWPVVVLDPIQRWQDNAKNEVEALNELVEVMGEHAENDGWIVFATSDTNKSSSTGKRGETKHKPSPQEEAANAFRGSYKLQHLVDSTIYLKPGEETDDKVEIKTVVGLNRWGPTGPTPTFFWTRATGRFVPKAAPKDMEL